MRRTQSEEDVAINVHPRPVNHTHTHIVVIRLDRSTRAIHVQCMTKLTLKHGEYKDILYCTQRPIYTNKGKYYDTCTLKLERRSVDVLVFVLVSGPVGLTDLLSLSCHWQMLHNGFAKV